MEANEPERAHAVHVATYRVRGRVLLVLWLFAVVLGDLAADVPGWLGHPLSAPIAGPIADVLGSLILLAFLMYPVRRSGRTMRSMVGGLPPPSAIGWAAGVALAITAISFVSVPVVFIPLSYVAPGFVQYWLIDSPGPRIWTEGDFYRLGNLFLFLRLCLLGPFAEEMTFRGLLLPAWASRVGRRWGLMWSSVCFGLGHGDLAGAFVFGVVTGVTFLRTNRLALPILIHVLANAFFWVIASADIANVSHGPATLEDLRHTWWLALVGLPGIPLMVVLMRRFPVPLS